MRKGRSIVHKNLEDNYGAVITANHEAIAQILEQVRRDFIPNTELISDDYCSNILIFLLFRFARTDPHRAP